MRTIKNKRNGSVLGCLVLILAAVGLCFYFFGSERVVASLSVFKGKAESAVVESAGKTNVAEELALRRIGDLRQKLVRLKSLKRTIKRDSENPDISADARTRYAGIVEKLDAAEKKAEAAYKKACSKFDELRVQLAMAETEISVARASASVLEGGTASRRLSRGDIDKVLASINAELDEANAELEVSLMENEE